MASIHRDLRGKSPFWFCAYTDQNGKRRNRSTKCRKKKQAQAVCDVWSKAVNLAKLDRLNVDDARQLIARGVVDVLAASGTAMPTITVRDWCDRWLKTKELENELSTHTRYELACRSFVNFLGRDADKEIAHLNSAKVLEFRDHCAGRLSVGTVNTHLRIVRACFNSARKQGLVERNAAEQVSSIKARGESKKRPLTLKEIQSVLEKCAGTHWRGLVLVGLYTGQRLGDCARLTWEQIDLQKQTVWFVTKKTGRRLAMHLAKPLLDYLTVLPAADRGDAFLFPKIAAMAEQNVSSLSNAFAVEVLIPAGLMPARAPKHKATGKGRTGRREVNPVSFHSLRHSFTTMLKATGASNALAQMIVGHDSPAVSARYTHLDASDTIESIERLPDVTR
jgi:integrase